MNFFDESLIPRLCIVALRVLGTDDLHCSHE